MSDTTEVGQAEPDKKSIPGNNESAQVGKDRDLERQATMKEGDVVEDPDAARLEWIRTAPESPRNWAPWRKCEQVPFTLAGSVVAGFSPISIDDDLVPNPD